ncbi:MAG TPA: polysaccharide deacetylase family protein [Chryseosolibacter sp.]|nr:polysaccharide deacetylase family protein [Chryseosolibacter sp.]
MIPHRTPFFLPFIYPTLTWRIKSNDKKLYLTFDDGPMPGPTDFVLKELAARSAKGTFFCIGDNVAKHQSMLQSIFSEGHAVGNHTYNHLNGWRSSDETYLQNIEKCADVLASKVSLTERPLFRPPYGRIRLSQIRKLTGFNIIMWDVLTHDYDGTLDGQVVLKKSIKATRSGSIIVFHDSLKAEKNLRYALPRFLDHFADLGYEFCSIP